VIRLGTSGFSYDDWVGPVYPADLPKRDWLAYYARECDTVELNVTYYRVPDHRTVQGWVDRTPPDFLFSVKAHQDLTHERKDPDFGGFVQSLAPLRESGKLACVLAQFPYSFHPGQRSREYLKVLREGLSELPVVVEFRDRAWVQEDMQQLLRQLELGFCCVDEPALPGLMPPVVWASGPVGYVRFHGRNAAKWWEHEQAWERYDYSYTEEELREWLPRLHELERAAPVVLAYANNHYRGQSLQALRLLRQLLAEASGAG
jgi:uncharacterized protein YecE (DUF72 family)